MNSRSEAAARAAFEALIDYAGLYPPAELGVDAAVAEYGAARSGSAAWMLGRFIAGTRQSAGVVSAWKARGTGDSLQLSVIAAVERDARRWFDSLRGALDAVVALRTEPGVLVEALEIPLAAPVSSRESFEAPIAQLRAALDRMGLGDLPVYVELPEHSRREELLPQAMAALARVHLHAKLRCGGIVAEAFPSVDAVAGFIATAAAERVAFKATAGLHHPVRHANAATGFVMHGFLNLLAAATFAPSSSAAELRHIVAEEDPRAFAIGESGFAWRDRRAGPDELRQMRATAFVGYGSCSFSEPVEDLTALGMLPAALA